MAEIQQEMAADQERIEGTLKALQKTLRRKRRSFVELAAIATCLHNAYSGMENLLKRVLQHVNIALPHTATPHNDLLNLAVEHKVISQELSYLGVGLVFRNYLRMRKVTPYLGARFVALISMPSRSDSITDFFFGLPYGGEFFLVPQFGIGVEAQANLVKSDEKSSRFGNPGGINVNTAAAFVANVYF